MDNNGIAMEATKANGNGVTTRQQPPPPSSVVVPGKGTAGRHLARRLVEVGVTDVFSVPGDFNLTLLDHILAEPTLNLIGCCNELNAGYAADGYARCRGVGACVVTFNVGSLSMINAIAGAYSEDLPIICIVGGPNSNDFGTNGIIHHSIGLPDFSQELSCFKTVTCHQAVIKSLEGAHEKIDTAISMAMSNSKPVYISICCNLLAIAHPSFSHKPVPLSLRPILSNQVGLAAAVEAAAEFLNKAVKPVMVGGPKLVVGKSCDAFIELADISGYPIAIMPSAKGLVPENHQHFIGTYWGAMSSPSCAETVESADAYLFVGPIFSDVTSAGHTLLVKKQKSIIVEPNRVVIGINGPAFGCILMKDFLRELAKKIKHNDTSYEIYNRIYSPEGLKKTVNCMPKDPLTINTLFHHIQKMLTGDNVVIAEVGDSWFNCQKLKLPQGCKYQCQMQYGSLGWSIGATLGCAQAVPEKRVIACIGDGCFQMAAQEISTILRCGQKSIIFLVNNGGYGIEVQIHDGPYNVIKNWDYTGLVDAIHHGEGKCWTTKVHSEKELVEAIEISTSGDKNDCFCFIEAIIQKNDTSKESLQMGSRLSAANSRPPNPH